MLTRQNTEDITNILNKISAKSRVELAEWFEDILSHGLERKVERELIISKMVILNNDYGGAASVVASTWYEDLRVQESITEDFIPQVFETADEIAIIKSTKWALGSLYTDRDKETTLNRLEYILDKSVKEAGRATIQKTSISDPACKGWARVPAGTETCAFCFMCASRGFVYSSEESAGKRQKFHHGCDCQIIPFWEKDKISIEGYDPEVLYDEYQAAYDVVSNRKENSDAPTAVEIASAMKELNPERYKQALVVPPVLTNSSFGWDIKKFEPMKEKTWRHILKRHADDGTAVSTFGDLDHEEIALLIQHVLSSPDRIEPSTRYPKIINYFKTTEYGEIIVGTTKPDNGLSIVNTAYPVHISE